MPLSNDNERATTEWMLEQWETKESHHPPVIALAVVQSEEQADE